MPAAPGELEMGPPPAAAAAVDVPEHRQVERGRFDAAVGKLRLRVLRRRHMGKDFIGPAFHLRSCRCRRPATRQFIPGSRTPGQALIGLLSEDGHTDGTS